MSIWLEDKIKDALVAVRWEQSGKGVNPKYFADAQSNYLKVNNLTAAWLAKFISSHVSYDIYEGLDGSKDDDFDKYNLEVLASYLEDHGYVVYFPD